MKKTECMLIGLLLFQHINSETKDLSEEKRFGVLLFDEMSVRHDLVFDRKSDEVIGFVNPGRISLRRYLYCIYHCTSCKSISSDL